MYAKVKVQEFTESKMEFFQIMGQTFYVLLRAKVPETFNPSDFCNTLCRVPAYQFD